MRIRKNIFTDRIKISNKLYGVSTSRGSGANGTLISVDGNQVDSTSGSVVYTITPDSSKTTELITFSLFDYSTTSSNTNYFDGIIYIDENDTGRITINNSKKNYADPSDVSNPTVSNADNIVYIKQSLSAGSFSADTTYASVILGNASYIDVRPEDVGGVIYFRWRGAAGSEEIVPSPAVTELTSITTGADINVRFVISNGVVNWRIGASRVDVAGIALAGSPTEYYAFSSFFEITYDFGGGGETEVDEDYLLANYGSTTNSGQEITDLEFGTLSPSDTYDTKLSLVRY